MSLAWHILDHMKWKIYRLRPSLMPTAVLREILERSPYVCRQIGQGSPMVVMRRDVWDVGGYEQVSGAPVNLDGEFWIVREWLRENPTWRPSSALKSE